MFRHFTIEELTNSDKARELGIDNTPDKDIIDRLTTLIIAVRLWVIGVVMLTLFFT